MLPALIFFAEKWRGIGQHEQVCWRRSFVKRQHGVVLASMHGPCRFKPELHPFLVLLFASSHLTSLTRPICKMGLMRGSTAEDCCEDHLRWWLVLFARTTIVIAAFLKTQFDLVIPLYQTCALSSPSSRIRADHPLSFFLLPR